MDFISPITFDQIVLSILTLGIVREMMILMLPDHIAGPGGVLVDTSDRKS